MRVRFLTGGSWRRLRHEGHANWTRCGASVIWSSPEGAWPPGVVGATITLRFAKHCSQIDAEAPGGAFAMRTPQTSQ
jgi:hypothetical protein